MWILSCSKRKAEHIPLTNSMSELAPAPARWQRALLCLGPGELGHPGVRELLLLLLRCGSRWMSY